MVNHLKLQQNIENDYEAQQLNEFYNQEDNKSKKEKLEKIRDNYKQKLILKQRNLNNESR